MLPVISLCTAEIPIVEINTHNSFYTVTGSDSEGFRKIIISYSRRNSELEHRADVKTPSASGAANEDEQVVDMQVQNTEEHHPRRHRNRHHHHHHNQKDQQRVDPTNRDLWELARDAQRQKGRNQHNIFHSSVSGHRKHQDGKQEDAQHVEVIVVPVVLETSRVAEMDDEIQEMDQQPVSIDKL
jgi:hypothetical protein